MLGDCAMPRTFDFVMTEHAGWMPTAGGSHRVFVMPDGGRWLATVHEGVLRLDPLDRSTSAPVQDHFSLPKMLRTVPDLGQALRGLGTVIRLRNADLWDAIGTAIIRQVIRAGQSKRLYREFCSAYGEPVPLPRGDVYSLFPSPATVIGLGDHQFASIGMAFKCRPLKAAAAAYLDDGAEWHELAPRALAVKLQSVRHIGPWTAHAAVADWSNDWSLYPYSDLAVRTWAMRAAPSYNWPTEETAFGQTWRTLAGDQLCSLTLLTLAWGSQYGDIG
jgi:DNA-3-methyladenine glycosylase II